MIWHCGQFDFDTRMPVVMGILNVTPDSFSDGGSYLAPDGSVDVASAVDAASALVAAGAKIIDVGGESTRPGHTPVDADEELARVEAVVRALVAAGMCVSIDTRHVDVARAAVTAGAAIINDVSGFSNPEMVALAAGSDVGVITLFDGTGTDVVDAAYDYLQTSAATLIAAGVDRRRICVDPGPGFGKDNSETMMLVRNFQEFRHLGFPVCCAVSRKRYIGEAFDNEEPCARDAASAEEALQAAELGCGVIRTHNVAATMKALEQLRPYVVIGLGCNVALVGGDSPEELQETKIAQLNLAIGDLCVLPDTQVIDVAPFYASEPAYYEDQDTFVNTVVLMRTGIGPHELLTYLHAIENKLGRVRDIENGPRTCDLDILDYQTYIANDEELVLPHPRICERDFVVKPFEAILPGHILADGKRVAAIPESERCGKAWKL